MKFELVIYNSDLADEEHFYFVDDVEVAMYSRPEGDEFESADLLFEAMAEFINKKQSLIVTKKFIEDDY